MTSTNEKLDPITARGIKLQGEYFADCNLLVDVIAKDTEAYKELERERNELAAQVERLRSAGYGIWEWVVGDMADGFPELRDALSVWEAVVDETPPAALTALKEAHFNDFCDCNVTAAKMRMATGKGLKITGFLTDDGKCCISGKVRYLEALKAEWQAEAFSAFVSTLENIKNEAECSEDILVKMMVEFSIRVTEQYLANITQHAQEVGDE